MENNDFMLTKKVYVSLIADLLHAGHIKILTEAAKLGEVTVGLLTSTAIHELNDTAYLKYQQRLDVIKNLTMVLDVIPQESASYKENLIKIKPDYVVHGDDWKEGIQVKTRQQVIDTISSWNGELVEIYQTKPLGRVIGEEIRVFYWKPTVPGDYYIEAIIDPDNIIDEFNELDNKASAEVNVVVEEEIADESYTLVVAVVANNKINK